MRAFIAIQLDAPMRAALTHVLHTLQAAQPPLRLKWGTPANQHLTLQFLGDIPSTTVTAIQRELSPVVSAAAPFVWTLQGLGCFPNQRQPKVLWVGVHEPTGALQRLQSAVNRVLANLGFTPETRPFAPHLTLARVPRDTPPHARHALGTWLSERPPPTPQTTRVTAIHLMQSELLPTGARYTDIAKFTLANSGLTSVYTDSRRKHGESVH